MLPPLRSLRDKLTGAAVETKYSGSFCTCSRSRIGSFSKSSALLMLAGVRPCPFHGFTVIRNGIISVLDSALHTFGLDLSDELKRLERKPRLTTKVVQQIRGPHCTDHPLGSLNQSIRV